MTTFYFHSLLYPNFSIYEFSGKHQMWSHWFDFALLLKIRQRVVLHSKKIRIHWGKSVCSAHVNLSKNTIIEIIFFSCHIIDKASSRFPSECKDVSSSLLCKAEELVSVLPIFERLYTNFAYVFSIFIGCSIMTINK